MSYNERCEAEILSEATFGIGKMIGFKKLGAVGIEPGIFGVVIAGEKWEGGETIRGGEAGFGVRDVSAVRKKILTLEAEEVDGRFGGFLEISEGCGDFGKSGGGERIVAVEEEEIFPAGLLDARIASFGETSVGLVNGLDGMGFLVFITDLASGIGGAVVDEDDLVIGEILAEDGIETGGQEVGNVVGGDDDGKFSHRDVSRCGRGGLGRRKAKHRGREG